MRTITLFAPTEESVRRMAVRLAPNRSFTIEARPDCPPSQANLRDFWRVVRSLTQTTPSQLRTARSSSHV